MRLFHSFLISLNAHIWGVVLLSLVFVVSRTEPRPRRIEVRLLKLPAPVDGDSVAISEMSLPRARADRRSDSEVALRPTSIREHMREKRGPRVEYRVRVAKSPPAVAVRDSGTWVPASSIRIQRSAEYAPGSRISGVSPESPSTGGGGAPKRANNEPQTINHDPLPRDDSIGGDTRPLIEIIQARIDAIAPLMHATAGPCQTEKGIVRLKFVVNQAGYPCGFRIVVSSGVRCLDDEVDNVLHMAEPYPYVAGWIPVSIRFAPRTRI